MERLEKQALQNVEKNLEMEEQNKLVEATKNPADKGSSCSRMSEVGWGCLCPHRPFQICRVCATNIFLVTLAYNLLTELLLPTDMYTRLRLAPPASRAGRSHLQYPQYDWCLPTNQTETDIIRTICGVVIQLIDIFIVRDKMFWRSLSYDILL